MTAIHVSSLRRQLAAGALAVLGLIATGCVPKTFEVTSMVDGESGSLRALITRANRAKKSARIAVPTGTYELTLCAAEDDDNTAGDLDITTDESISIVATGPNVIIRQTCAHERVLDGHGAGELIVSGLTLTGGWAYSGDGGGIRGNTVRLEAVTLTGNRGTNGGGVAATTLDADGVTVSSNLAVYAGGGIFAPERASVTRATVEKNTAREGAGIAVNGPLVIRDSRVSGNTAEWLVYLPGFAHPLPAPTSGAGIRASSVEGDRIAVYDNFLNSCTNRGVIPIPMGEASGGAISAGSASLRNSTLSGNRGGDCDAASVGIYPPSGTAVHADTLTLEYVTLADNTKGSTIATSHLVSFGSAAIASGSERICEQPIANEASYSWFSDASCGLTGVGNRQASTAFLLAPLAQDGGFVPTRAPALASPLVDQIPAAECRIASDGRGAVRPQGSGCDIGAVEAIFAPGLGAANLALDFIASPESMIAGRVATWQIRVRNAGPRAAAPSVYVQVPASLRVQSITASAPGNCEATVPISCSLTSLAAGGSAVISVTGELVEYTPAVTIQATALWPMLEPPFTDDAVAATTRVDVDGAVRMAVLVSGSIVRVDLFSVGPYSAAATAERPMAVLFHPAAGVSAEFDDNLPTKSLYPVSDAPFGSQYFRLDFTGAAPDLLGTVELLPGISRVDGPSVLPVYNVPPPDLAVRLRRQPGVVDTFAPLPVTVELSNVGAGAAQDVTVNLEGIQYYAAESIQADWAPTTGSIEQVGPAYVWHVPSLAAGQTLSLNGTVITRVGYRLRATSAAGNYDPNSTNDVAELGMGPSPFGTVDLQVSALSIVPLPSGGQYVVQTAIKNAGEVAYANPYPESPPPALVVSWQVEGDVSVSGAQPGGWSCNVTERTCTSHEPLAAGSSAGFAFTLTGRLESVSARVTGDELVFPDSDPSNNSAETRYY